jgi:RNA polymerase sigma-70 factor (ECF subfamily)
MAGGSTMTEPSSAGGLTCQSHAECAIGTAQPSDGTSEAPAALTEYAGRSASGPRGAEEVERTLLHRVSRGDRGAFRELYMHYHGRLAHFLSRVTRDQSEREEIINDALLIVWQQAGSFRGASRVSTWIFGIAYRCALKSVRRSSARARALLLAAHDGEGFSEDVANSVEDRQLLDHVLACLPPAQRLVLVLAYCMEYSCEEIAAIAECPVNTVKTRMFYARRKLRAVLSASNSAHLVPAD